MTLHTKPFALLVATVETAILFEVAGKDSERYLNNRLSNNIKALEINGTGTYGAALSVQGKTEGLFYTVRKNADSYLLLCDAGDPASILSALSRYKVADRVSFKDDSAAYQLVHAYCKETDIETLEKSLLHNEKIREKSILHYRRNRFGSPGIDFVIPKNSALQETFQSETYISRQMGAEEQHLERLSASIPSFPTEVGPDFLLQECDLQGCYSITKGCYVGQEVIQKIASFASTPAKLLGFVIDGKIDQSAVPKSEPDGDQKIGELISSAYNPGTNRSFGFMRIKSKLAHQPLEIKGFIDKNMIGFRPVFDFTNN